MTSEEWWPNLRIDEFGWGNGMSLEVSGGQML
jgi:hypothetical protein